MFMHLMAVISMIPSSLIHCIMQHVKCQGCCADMGAAMDKPRGLGQRNATKAS